MLFSLFEEIAPVTAICGRGNFFSMFTINNSTTVIQYIDIIQDLYFNDTGRQPSIIYFDNLTKMNEYMYDIKLRDIEPHMIDMGFYFRSYEKNDDNTDESSEFFDFFNQTITLPNNENNINGVDDQISISLFYNSTSGFTLDATDTLLACTVNVYRIKYYHEYSEIPKPKIKGRPSKKTEEILAMITMLTINDRSISSYSITHKIIDEGLLNISPSTVLRYRKSLEFQYKPHKIRQFLSPIHIFNRILLAHSMLVSNIDFE